MLYALGVNHRSAPIHIRENLCFSKAEVNSALRHLVDELNPTEAAILSTCNRAEVYCDSIAPDQIFSWWENYLGIKQSELDPFFYSFTGRNTVKHLMRVASGLDSMVLGEPQILGQLKVAYQTAHQEGVIGKRLSRLFETSFYCAKQIRSQTTISSNPVSIAYACVSLAKKLFPDLTNARVLLIGAGQTIELVLRHLKRYKVENISIANRSQDSLIGLINKYNVQGLSLLNILPEVINADVIISATGSPHYILDYRTVSQGLESCNRSKLIVDLAVPRDVDPNLANIEGLSLYCIDDLQSIISQNFARREMAAVEAESIIEHQASNYMRWYYAQSGVKTLRLFRENVTNIKEKEYIKAYNKLQNGVEPQVVLKEFANKLTNKILHTPTVNFKQALIKNEQHKIEALQQLFDLTD